MRDQRAIFSQENSLIAEKLVCFKQVQVHENCYIPRQFYNKHNDF